jgi:hypothetical protein
MALALYGTIAAGLALAVGVDAALGTAAVIGVVVVELMVFFLAHAYVDMLGERFDHPGLRLSQRVRHACGHDVFLLFGGLPILLVFAVARAAGADTDVGADIALAAPILLLGGFGYVAARRGRAAMGGALGEGLFAALLGLGVLLLKLVLH